MKIIQLNIWGGLLLKNALHFLKKEGPDIVTLQEVTFSSRGKNVFASVKKELSMDGIFARAYDTRTEQGIIHVGNAVFSNFDIIRHRTIFYDFQPRLYTDRLLGKRYTNMEGILTEPKNFLSVVLDAEGKKLRVVSTHLAWSERCSERWHRIVQARKLVSSLKGEMPMIVTGDFNTHPRSLSFSIINERFGNLGEEISNTLNPKRHEVFRERHEGYVVDYILGRGVTGHAHAPLVDVSDHLPLVAEIRI